MSFFSRQNIILTAFLAFQSPIMAQEIKELKDLGEKGGSVEVAIPADKHFNKSDKICFQSDKKKPAGCGKIFKMTDSSIFVRVTAATFAKLQDRYTAILEEGDAKSAAPGDAATRKGTAVKTILRLTASPILVSPTAYNTVTYSAPTLSDSTTPNNSQFWLRDKPGTTSLVSMMLEWGRFLGPKSGFSLGLRYRYNPETTLLADYVTGVSTSYVTITHRLTGVGLLADYAFYKNDVSSTFNVFFATGLEFENTNLVIAANATDEAVGQTQNIASLNSKMIAMSLRLRPGLDWNPSKWFGIHTGLTIMVPLVKFAASATASVDDPHSLDKSTAVDDLKTAAGHKLNRYGVGLDLGLSSKF